MTCLTDTTTGHCAFSALLKKTFGPNWHVARDIYDGWNTTDTDEMCNLVLQTSVDKWDRVTALLIAQQRVMNRMSVQANTTAGSSTSPSSSSMQSPGSTTSAIKKPLTRRKNTVATRRTEGPTAVDWAAIRPTFEGLYCDTELTTMQIRAELLRVHKFNASVKMTKTYIRRWNLSRYISQSLAEHVIGITADCKERGEGTPEFQLRGRIVDMDNIHRYQRRKKLSNSTAIAAYRAGKSQPIPDLRWFTQLPQSVPLHAPQRERSIEHLLFEFQHMTLGQSDHEIHAHQITDRGLYTYTDNRASLVPSVRRSIWEITNATRWVSYNVKGCFNTHDELERLKMLAIQRFNLAIEDLTLQSDAELWLWAIQTICNFTRNGMVEFAITMMNHLHNFSRQKLGSNQPQAKFLTALLQTSLQDVSSGLPALTEVSVKCHKPAVSTCAVTRWWQTRRNWYVDRPKQGWINERTAMMNELKYCMDHFGKCSCQTLWVLRECSFFYPILMEDADIKELVQYLIQIGTGWLSGDTTVLSPGADLTHDVALTFALCRQYETIGMFDLALRMLNKLSEYEIFHHNLTLADMLSLELRFRRLARLTGCETNNGWLRKCLENISEEWTDELIAAGIKTRFGP